MTDTTVELFDLSEYKIEKNDRKKPQSKAEKRLEDIKIMEDSDFKNLQRKLNRSQILTAAEAKRLDEYRIKFEIESGVHLPPGIVRTQREVAEHFGCHIQTVKNWCSRGMPRLPDSYNLDEIKEWAITQRLINRDSTDSVDVTNDTGNNVSGYNVSDNKDKAYWDKENAKAQTKSRQLANKVMEGKLVYAEDVYANYFEAARMARDSILNIGPIIATDLSKNDEQRRQILETYNHIAKKILEDLSSNFDAERNEDNL